MKLTGDCNKVRNQAITVKEHVIRSSEPSSHDSCYTVSYVCMMNLCRLASEMFKFCFLYGHGDELNHIYSYAN